MKHSKHQMGDIASMPMKKHPPRPMPGMMEQPGGGGNVSSAAASKGKGKKPPLKKGAKR